MADIRRAYRAWLLRRLLWLVPSFLLACGVAITLAVEPALPLWAGLPSIALSAGVAVLMLVFVLRSLRVVRERSLGRIRRAQLLRSELRPSPGLGVALLLLLLGLLLVPLLFTESPRARAIVVHRPSQHSVVRRPVEPVVADLVVVPGDPAVRIMQEPVRAPDPPRAPEPAPVPQIVPEIARPPALALRLEDLELPVRPLVQDDASEGSDRFGMKHRPSDDEDIRSMGLRDRKPFSRAGLPAENDQESWIPPELKFDVMLISQSGPWRGYAFELDFDLPVGRDDSVRLTYTAMMLSDDEEIDGPEPSFAWHRATLEYVYRLAGYSRQSTFDLAIRIGMSLDRLSTHEAGLSLHPSMRISPWIGLESAVWEDDGVGLVMQAGFSPATRLTGGSSRVADVRIFVRIDLGEQSSLELGYRIVAVQFRDRHESSEEAYTDKMNRSFKGPMFGLALRF